MVCLIDIVSQFFIRMLTFRVDGLRLCGQHTKATRMLPFTCSIEGLKLTRTETSIFHRCCGLRAEVILRFVVSIIEYSKSNFLSLQITKALINHGAKVNVGDKYGTTALVWASRKGYTEIVELLLKAGGVFQKYLKNLFDNCEFLQVLT